MAAGRRGARRQLRPVALQPRLRLAAAVQHVPHVPRVLPLRVDRPQGRLDGRAPIAGGRAPAQPALLRQPQQQRPALRVHRQRALRGPHRVALRVHQRQVRPAPVVAVDPVQGDRPRPGRRVARHPGQRPPLGLADDRADRPQADAPPAQRPQAGLDAALARVGLHQQRQHRSRQVARAVRPRRHRRERLLQRPQAPRLPAIQRLARGPRLAAQQRHQAVRAALRDQPADPPRPLAGRARMLASHALLPGPRG